MSVHSNHYDNWEEYQADLAFEYRNAKEDFAYQTNDCRECSSFWECREYARQNGGGMCDNCVNYGNWERNFADIEEEMK